MKPQEQYQHILNLLKDREAMNYPTFYTIKIERFGKYSPVVERENGSENFTNHIFKCLTTYNPNHLLIELYKGKSPKVKEAFEQFKIGVNKTQSNTNEIQIEGLGSEKAEITPSEQVISVERYYDTRFDLQTRLIRNEYEKQRMEDTINKLNEIIAEQKSTIEELESELEESKDGLKNNLGNITLGHIGSIALERFAKSETGIGLLKGILGASDEQLKGLLGKEVSSKESEESASEQKSTASIINDTENKSEQTKEKEKENSKPLSEEQKVRNEIIKVISDYLNKNSNESLRLHYEVIQEIQGSVSILKQIKASLQVLNQNPDYVLSVIKRAKTSDAVNNHSKNAAQKDNQAPPSSGKVIRMSELDGSETNDLDESDDSEPIDSS